MAFVGELMARFRLDTSQFDNRLRAAKVELKGATTSAASATGAMDAFEKALIGTGRAAELSTKAGAKLRASQYSAMAATEAYNVVLRQSEALLATETATTEQLSAMKGRLASAEARLIRANEAVRASSPAASIARTGEAADASAASVARYSPPQR